MKKQRKDTKMATIIDFYYNNPTFFSDIFVPTYLAMGYDATGLRASCRFFRAIIAAPKRGHISVLASVAVARGDIELCAFFANYLPSKRFFITRDIMFEAAKGEGANAIELFKRAYAWLGPMHHKYDAVIKRALENAVINRGANAIEMQNAVVATCIQGPIMKNIALKYFCDSFANEGPHACEVCDYWRERLIVDAGSVVDEPFSADYCNNILHALANNRGPAVEGLIVRAFAFFDKIGSYKLSKIEALQIILIALHTGFARSDQSPRVVRAFIARFLKYHVLSIRLLFNAYIATYAMQHTFAEFCAFIGLAPCAHAFTDVYEDVPIDADTCAFFSAGIPRTRTIFYMMDRYFDNFSTIVALETRPLMWSTADLVFAASNAGKCAPEFCRMIVRSAPPSQIVAHCALDFALAANDGPFTSEIVDIFAEHLNIENAARAAENAGPCALALCKCASELPGMTVDFANDILIAGARNHGPCALDLIKYALSRGATDIDDIVAIATAVMNPNTIEICEYVEANDKNVDWGMLARVAIARIDQVSQKNIWINVLLLALKKGIVITEDELRRICPSATFAIIRDMLSTALHDF